MEGAKRSFEVLEIFYREIWNDGYVGLYICQSSSICTPTICVLVEYKKYLNKEVKRKK